MMLHHEESLLLYHTIISNPTTINKVISGTFFDNENMMTQLQFIAQRGDILQIYVFDLDLLAPKLLCSKNFDGHIRFVNL